MHRAVFALAATLAAALGLFAAPAQAQQRTSWSTSWIVVEEWTETDANSAAHRMVPLHREAEERAIARFGPFRVLGEGRAALVDVTDSRSPAQFAAMLRAYPALRTLEMVECPGTEDDRANLALGRMIRAAGLETHVPRGGSVRSGAVELFLGGATRRIDDGAEFAVHAWIDEDGREAGEFAAGSAEHRPYLAYYREMGMAADRAERFYAMTNSVGFTDAKWLGAAEMRGWLGEGKETGPESEAASPQIAYHNLAYLDLANLDSAIALP